MVGAARSRLVDGGAVRRRLVPLRAGHGARVCGRRGRAARRDDVLHRVAVLHLGRLPAIPRGGRRRATAPRCRPPQGLRVPARPDRLAATAVQSVGTLEFNVSTFAAISPPVGSAQAQHHVWRPDTSVRPASGRQRARLVRGVPRLGGRRPRSLAWWITGVNLAGSVAFGFSAVASYVVPGTTEMLSVPGDQLGTFVGAVCFLAGAVLLLFERPRRSPPSRPPGYPAQLSPCRPLQVAGPVLASQVLPETVVPALVVQGEAGPLVDAPGVGQHVVGPQGDAGVPGPAREPQHLVD